jgi:predicted metal-dependent hydrolase
MEPTATLQQGIAEFNRQEFYTCHDLFEALWMDATEPDRSFYQGILQIAVACYHLGNLNWRGAVTLLGEGTRRLYSYQPSYATVNVEQFLAESWTLLEILQATDPERIPELLERISSDRARDGAYRFPTLQMISE